MFKELTGVEGFVRWRRMDHVERVHRGLDKRWRQGLPFGPPVKWTRLVANKAQRLREKGYSYQRIAEALSLSTGTVFTRLNQTPNFKLDELNHKHVQQVAERIDDNIDLIDPVIDILERGRNQP